MRVFYNHRQQADVLREASYSPSMSKPAKFMAHISTLVDSGEVSLVEDFSPVTREEFYKVHEADYVDSVLDQRINNGFGNKSREITHSLPWTSGSFRAAALDAVENGGVTCSPTSGFHHAGYANGWGFCTFNGLMVAVDALKEQHPGIKIAIIDFDMHYGDGTEDIMYVVPRLAGPHLHVTDCKLVGSASSRKQHPDFVESAFMSGIEQGVNRVLAESPSVILYQAGADSHVEDPLGGVFTTEMYRQRDRIVFEAAASANIPVAWNLAGGYQTPIKKVLNLHSITVEEALRADYATENFSEHRARAF